MRDWFENIDIFCKLRLTQMIKNEQTQKENQWMRKIAYNSWYKIIIQAFNLSDIFTYNKILC